MRRDNSRRLLGAVSFYRRVVMRKGALRGLDADVAQPAVVNILATHARTPEATVHDAVAAIVANAAELGRINPLFEGLGDLFQPLKTDGAKALEFGGVALAPGRGAGLPRGRVVGVVWRQPQQMQGWRRRWPIRSTSSATTPTRS